MARVLLVEDHPEVRETVRIALEEAGHDVCDAADFETGLRLLTEDGPWDFLLANAVLPGRSDGVRLSAEAQSRDIRSLVMTGHPDQMMQLHAAGTEHLRKPFSVAELVDAVAGKFDTAVPAGARAFHAPCASAER